MKLKTDQKRKVGGIRRHFGKFNSYYYFSSPSFVGKNICSKDLKNKLAQINYFMYTHQPKHSPATDKKLLNTCFCLFYVMVIVMHYAIGIDSPI